MNVLKLANGAQQEIIASTVLDNSAYSASYSAYDSAPTADKLFLLSYSDVQNTAYGFSMGAGGSSALQARGSDYAKCQGLYVDASTKCSRWWLRSAGYYSDLACSVDLDGWVSDYYYGTSDTNFGVRPALKLDLTLEILQSDVSEVGSVLPGDVNKDGVINLKDVVVLRRYLSGGWNVAFDEFNSDVNRDHLIDLKDTVLITRYLVGGWNVTLQ